MDSELIQFGAMLGMFLAGAIAWFFVIYLPGRSMEGEWQGDRAEREERALRKSVREERETTTV